MIKSLFTFILVSLIGLLFAQSQGVNFTYGKDVTCTAIEGNYLWVGTTGGLVKIDRLTGATTFFNKSNSGLIYNHITSLAIGSDGVKWIGTYEAGLVSFDNENWVVYNTSNSILNNQIHCLAVDLQQNLWCAYNGGVAKFDGENWYHYDQQEYDLLGSSLISIVIDSQNNKWFGTTGYGLIKYDNLAWTNIIPQYSYDLTYIWNMAIDSQDNIWMGLSHGMVKFDGSNCTGYDSPFEDLGYIGWIPSSIVVDSQGNKWMGTEAHGLIKFDGNNWTRYDTSNSGLPSNYIPSISIDPQGNKWIGSSGIVKYDGENWTAFNTSNSGVPYEDVTCITIDSTNNKWIGTSFGGLACYNGVDWSVYNLNNSGLPSNRINCITEDSEHHKWIGTFDGLACFDGSNWTVYNPSNPGAPMNCISSISIDSQGIKWIGLVNWYLGYHNGLARFDGNNWIYLNSSNSPLPSDGVTCIAIGTDDNIWIGTGEGLANYHNEAWTIYNTSNSGLPFNAISSINIDHEGVLWIGTFDTSSSNFEVSLAKFNDGIWSSYILPNSPVPQQIVSIAIDSQDVKWLSLYSNWWMTSGGLLRFDEQHWELINWENSILPVNSINCLTLDSQDNKWIGTTRSGLTEFYWDAFYDHDDIIVPVNDEVVIPNKSLTLSNYPNPFNPSTTISFDLSSPGKVNLDIYNIKGQFVKSLFKDNLNTGNHSISWNGTDEKDIAVSSGVYFARIIANGKSAYKKMVLVK